MDLAIIVMLTCFAATMGSRAQALVIALEQGLRRSALLISAAVFAAAVATFAAAVLGAWFAAQLVGFARAALVGSALALAAIELIWPVRQIVIREPTWSLGAIILALLVKQLGEAPRWIAFAAAAMTSDPLKAGFGVWIGSSLALLVGWIMPSILAFERCLRWFRGATACLALGACIYVLWVGANIGA